MWPSNKTGRRQTSSRGVWFLMVFITLQVISIIGADVTIVYDMQVFLEVDTKAYGMHVSEMALCIVLYTLPILFAISGDTLVGRYTLIFVGSTLKFSGNCLGLVMVSALTKYSVPEGNTTAMILIRMASGLWMAVYIFGTLCMMSSLVSFTFDHCKETTATVAWCARWTVWCLLLGMLIGGVDAYFLRSIKDLKLWLLSKHIIMCAAEALGLAVFLLGKPNYNIRPYDEGQKSWKDLFQIMKTVMLCRRNTLISEEIFTSHEKTRQKRLSDRLRFKRGFLLIAIFSVMAFAWSAIYVLVRIGQIDKPGWTYLRRERLLHQTRYLPGVALIPVIEIFVRKAPCSFWQQTTKDMLKLFGVGAFLMSLALTAAGGYMTIESTHYGLSMFWMLPQYILEGFAILITSIPMVNLWYTESPRGLASLITAIALCLVLLAPVVEKSIDIRTRVEAGDHGDIVLYAWAAIMLVMVVVVYLPLCMSYLKTKRAIEALEAEDDLDITEDNTTLIGQTGRLLTGGLSSATGTLPGVTGIRNYSSIIGRSTINYAEVEDDLADLWLPGEERVA